MGDFNARIVKSYDIRGVVPGELDEEFAYRFGRALARVMACGGAVIGHDARLSSPALYQSLAKGLSDEGVNTVGLGLCQTELVYFAAGEGRGVDLGVMVTASHNPPEYNGFKVVRAGGEPVTGPTGLQQAFDLAVEMPGHLGRGEADIQPLHVLDDYVAFCLKLAGLPAAQGLKVAVDPGNGVAGLLWKGIGGLLGVELTLLNAEPDGRFPAHHPDPSAQENLQDLIHAVDGARADLGLAYDGDGDRVVAVLPGGHVVNGSETVACLAERLMEKGSGEVLGAGQTMSRRALDHFRNRDLDAVIVPVGHSKIKRVMRADKRMLFAGEDAGHYYFRDFYCCDSSLITTLHLLQMVVQGGLSGFVNSLPGPWHRPVLEPAFRFEDQSGAFAVCRRAACVALESHDEPLEITCEIGGEVRRHCTRGDLAAADSVRADYEDWWFCVRPSGTEPVVRLAVEAGQEALLQERLAELQGYILCV